MPRQEKVIELRDVYATREGTWPYDQNVSILYQLLCEREPWMNISHKKVPTFNKHKEFVESRPYKSWYVIFDDATETPVGSVYMSKNNEIGLFILKEYTNQGYGRAAVNEMLKLYGKDFVANINPLNKPCIALFEKMGFEHVQNTYKISQ